MELNVYSTPYLSLPPADRDDKWQQDPTAVEETRGDCDGPESRRMCSDYICRSGFCRAVRLHVFALKVLG